MELGRRRWEERLWTRRGQGSAVSRLMRSPLRALSLVYGAAVSARAAAYEAGIKKARRVAAKVIVVGNLTVGGAGKTPLTAWIARKLAELKFRVVVLGRGYRAKGEVWPRVVSEGHGLQLPVELAGDEAALLTLRLPGVPVVVGADREAAGQLACEKFGATHLVLDDGFQHLQLARDLNILVVDSRRNPEEEYLLPRGPLREPISAARRADLLVFSRAESPNPPDWPWLQRLCPAVPRFVMRLRPLGLVPLHGPEIRPLGRPSLAFCGIGSPESFFAVFRNAGGNIAKEVVFDDHHEYRAEDLDRLITEAGKAGAERLVTTEKDAVKIRAEWTQGFPLEVFRVEPDFLGGEEKFLELVLDFCGNGGEAA